MTTALYMRLSLADGDLGKDGKDESNSIENQRTLLEHHIETHQELAGDTVEYVDDGYSGTNFDRPAFRRMIEDAKKRRFQTILVKDLSRLGRDYIGVGDYIDQILPILGIRLIAVNSNYDSEKYQGKTLGLDMTVTNLVNTMYSRDISKKVKSGLMSRWKQGMTTCGNPPYGFIKDERARGGWAVDPVAGAVVRKIFDKALEGYNTKDIANYLNEEKIPTPGKYRRMCGRDRGHSKVPESEILWNNCMVLSVIQRYEYCGAFVHNKRTKIKVGQRETRNVPEHERIIIEDAHDAIVTKDEFYQAQEIRQKQRKHKAYRVPINYTLKGKVFCGNCGLALAYQSNLYDPIFYCPHGLNTGDASKCCKEHYSERILEETVYRALCKELEKASALQAEVKEKSATESNDTAKRLRRMQKQADIARAERIRCYEAFADGHISKEEYIKKKEKLTSDIEELEIEIKKLKEIEQRKTDISKQMNELGNVAENVLAEGHLTEEMVKRFVEKVHVYDTDHIEIAFQFDDVIRKVIDEYEDGDEKC